MAFSAGFHPHQKISYAGAAPTGAASEAEYFEIQVTERVDPEALRAALDAALPDGLDILEVVVAGPGSLAERLQGSRWRMEFDGVEPAALAAAVEALRAAGTAEVTRTFKTGPKTFDVLAAVVDLAVEEASAGGAAEPTGAPCAILTLVVRSTTPTVRPDDVLTALRAVAGFAQSRPPRVTRLAQGPIDDAGAGVADPLAADRDAAGS
jgi:radical SAM-linked protein